MVTVRNIIRSKVAEAVATTQYSETGVTTIIDKFTVTNGSGAAESFEVNLVPPGGAADATNLILDKTIAVGETYTCPELVGQVLDSGGAIVTNSGSAVLVISASGREIS